MPSARKWSGRALPAERLDPRLGYKAAKTPTDLYFIETECAERHIKIGIASNVASRLASMQGHCPYRIRLLKMVPGGAHLEQGLHIRFTHDRLFGEWFRRSNELLAVIAEMDGPTEFPKPKKAADIPLDIGNMADTWRTFCEIGEEEWGRRAMEKAEAADPVLHPFLEPSP